MQVIAARLGVVTGKDLAQCCRDWYPAWTRWPNWLLCEVAIGACDLAEVLGSAVAINLLFHIPLFWAVIITAFDVLLLLALAALRHAHDRGGGCRPGRHHRRLLLHRDLRPSRRLSRASWKWGSALISPGFRQAGMIYVAIGIIGATVMPHNLYLHSALVQSRKFQKDDHSIRQRDPLQHHRLRPSSLTIAFFVNAAILVLAAMVFFGKESVTVPADRWSSSAPTATGFASPT